LTHSRFSNESCVFCVYYIMMIHLENKLSNVVLRCCCMCYTLCMVLCIACLIYEVCCLLLGGCAILGRECFVTGTCVVYDLGRTPGQLDLTRTCQQRQPWTCPWDTETDSTSQIRVSHRCHPL